MSLHTCGSEQALREIVSGLLGSRAILKERAVLDTHCRAFIALSPFVLVATGAAENAAVLYAIMSNLAVIQANLAGLPRVSSN